MAWLRVPLFIDSKSCIQLVVQIAIFIRRYSGRFYSDLGFISKRDILKKGHNDKTDSAAFMISKIRMPYHEEKSP